MKIKMLVLRHKIKHKNRVTKKENNKGLRYREIVAYSKGNVFWTSDRQNLELRTTKL